MVSTPRSAPAGFHWRASRLGSGHRGGCRQAGGHQAGGHHDLAVQQAAGAAVDAEAAGCLPATGEQAAQDRAHLDQPHRAGFLPAGRGAQLPVAKVAATDPVAASLGHGEGVAGRCSEDWEDWGVWGVRRADRTRGCSAKNGVRRIGRHARRSRVGLQDRRQRTPCGAFTSGSRRPPVLATINSHSAAVLRRGWVSTPGVPRTYDCTKWFQLHVRHTSTT